jgi:hypothetical protein
MLPLFFLLVFGLLQAAQAGIAIVVANYAASSVARRAANGQNPASLGTGSNVALENYRSKINSFLVAGVGLDDFKGCMTRADPSVPTGELAVAVRTKLPAWPVIGQVLHKLLSSDYEAPALTCQNIDSAAAFSNFNFSSDAPYTIYITGKAKVRLNYVQ